MAKRNRGRRVWTSEHVRTLKVLARKKTPAGKIARSLKRSEGATRQKAFSLGLSLDSHLVSVSHSRRASARAKNASGTTRPTVFALLRLTASSNFVGCSMGRSLGRSPCRTLCTNLALSRNKAGPSAPYDIRPSGTTRPMVFALLRLTASSNFVGCSILGSR